MKLTGKATAALRPRPGAAPRDVSAVLATSPANVAPVAGPLSGPRPPEKKASFIIGAPVRARERGCCATAAPLLRCMYHYLQK